MRNNFTIQTIEFVNATVGNIGAMGSIDKTTIISLFAVLISFLALYFTHLRGMSISLFWEYELPELPEDDFKMDVATSLPLKVDLSVLNSGNRAGIVKDFNLKFNPQRVFEEFYEERGFSGLSASPILIKDRDTAVKSWGVHIYLDQRIEMTDHLRTIDIKSDNLKTPLEEMLEYKKEMLRKFIKFLKTNEKLGYLIISYRYTRPKLIFLPYIEFKKKAEKLEVKHSYKKTIECYRDSLKNYQLIPHPTEVIKRILHRIKSLEEQFDICYKEIEKRPKEEIFHLSLNISWINEILNNADEEIELLSKCGNYRKTIEDDVKPLLKMLLIFNRKAEKAAREPTEKLKQSSIEELRKDSEELREKRIAISPKLEDLKKKVERELRE